MITFDGVELKNVAPFDLAPKINTTDTLLASGKHSVQTSTETGFAPSFDCVTQDYADITAILGKIGVIGPLVIDGVEHPKCAIRDGMSIKQVASNVWKYTVPFVEDTS